jgi:hypothetical protein
VDLTPEPPIFSVVLTFMHGGDTRGVVYRRYGPNSTREGWAIPGGMPDDRSYSWEQLNRLGRVVLLDDREAAYRAGREDAARDIEVFGERARGRAQQYAGELSICSRRSNDAVVDTYMKSASLARSGDVRNVQCSNCRDTRGGPIGHETGECTWKPCNTAHQPRTPSGCDGEDSPEERQR